MLIIVNPYATTVSDRLKHLVVYALQGRYDVEAIDTQRSGHATELCREAAGEGYDVVVAFGGDGTINEAANGLAGSDTPLTCLPGGATNVYPRMLGIPNDVVDATEHLLRIADDWHPRWVDLGEVNGRLFTFAAGAGLDASSSAASTPTPSSRPATARSSTPRPRSASSCAATSSTRPSSTSRSRARRSRGISAFVQVADPYTYFRDRPIELVDGLTLDSGDLGGASCARQPDRHPHRDVAGAVAEGEDREAPPGHRLPRRRGFTRPRRRRPRGPGAGRRRLRRRRTRTAVFRARPRALRVVA